MRHELWDALEPLRRRPEGLPVKWVRPENIHISLKFLGEVDEAREAELRAALKHAAGAGGAGGAGGSGGPGAGGEPRSLTLQITGFGVFPDYHRPHVLWAGVTPEPGLELLQHRVEQAFAPLGFPTEGRPFRPHVTLGRSTRNAKPCDFTGLQEILDGIAFDETVTIDNVELMQSTLQPEGPVYQVRYHERLS